EGGYRADALSRVRRACVSQRLNVAKKVAAGRRFVPYDFLFDGSAFVLPFRLRIEDIAHAIRLDAKDRIEVGRRHGELVLSERVGRFCIEPAAQSGRDRAELA